MVKTITYDLRFERGNVVGLTEKGVDWLHRLRSAPIDLSDPKAIYARAWDDGLHIEFSTPGVRDRVTSNPGGE